MLLQQSIEHVSIVYTCNTYFVIHWSMQFIRQYLVIVLIQYLRSVYKTHMHMFNNKEKKTSCQDKYTHLYEINVRINTRILLPVTFHHVHHLKHVLNLFISFFRTQTGQLYTGLFSPMRGIVDTRLCQSVHQGRR